MFSAPPKLSARATRLSDTQFAVVAPEQRRYIKPSSASNTSAGHLHRRDSAGEVFPDAESERSSGDFTGTRFIRTNLPVFGGNSIALVPSARSGSTLAEQMPPVGFGAKLRTNA